MKTLFSLVTLAALTFAPLEAPAADPEATRKVHALFERHWEENARLYPIFATMRGDHRYNDRHNDRSAAGIERESRYWRELLGEIEALKPASLSKADRLSLQLLEHTAAQQVEGFRHPGWKTYTVNASSFPFHGQFASVMRAMPMETAAQAEQMLARIAAYPKRVDEEIVQLRRGMELGWVPSKALLQRALQQIETQLKPPPERSAFAEPWGRLGKEIPQATREALRKRGIDAIARAIYPAQQKLRDFIVKEYLPAAPAEGGLGAYKGGPEAYAYLVRVNTTTSLSPREIHRIGLERVASLRAEMDSLIRATGFAGDMPAYVKHLNDDPKSYHESPAALLTAYQSITKRLDAEMPKLFVELPRAPYGVRSIPEFMGPGAAENYNSPPLDGSAPGWFNANTMGYKIRPKYGMYSTAAHETVPGHHTQMARAGEMKDVPQFRRAFRVTAFSEGWALYAETLMDELGFYTDDNSRFGYLQNQLWRAVRLVVDTGMHSEGWSRQRAIDYMQANVGLAPERVAQEIDRYLSMPGQALAYMIGQLRMLELRANAKKALGEKFDLRKFNNAVIDQGLLPLDLLEKSIEEWVQEQKK
jgi:uncharacterized protein (DUF885 family)